MGRGSNVMATSEVGGDIMFSGYLDKRVSVTKVEKVFDGRGGYTNRETPLGEFWAAMLPLSIYEQSQYQAINTSVSIKVYMRYNSQITKGSKILFRGKNYEIKGIINPAFSDEFIELVVNEV
jgi:SPP1 family predicted phage head-tail adaptor